MSATITFSLEVELGWGVHDLENFEEAMESHSENRQKETKTLNDLLETCEKSVIPFTFDVVGHLFRETCNGTHLGPHPEGWFTRDPGTDLETDPHFFAPDLIDAIKNSQTNHEICTHTFSHIPCSQVSDEVVDWEFQRVREIHEEKLDQRLVSFVPPRHSPPPKEMIKKHNIKIIREPVSRTKSKTKLHTLIDDLFRKHPVQKPKIVDGIVESYSSPAGSLNANHLPDGNSPPHPIYRVIPVGVRKLLHKKYLMDALDQAIEEDSYAHFWSHLHDITNKHQIDIITWFIKEVAQKRDAGNVEVLTMDELNYKVREHDGQ